MNNLKLFLLTFLIGFSITAQEILEKTIPSNQFRTNRDFKLYLPQGYEKDTATKYPVAIVLDDSYLFDVYVGSEKLFASYDIAPKQIVIGVKTYIGENQDVSVIEENGGLTANGKRFYKFISDELLPDIQGKYRTSPFTTVVGVGKSANYLTYFLKDDKPIFNGYVCISPIFNEHSLKLINSYQINRFDNAENSYFFYLSSSELASEKDMIVTNNLNEYFTESKLKKFIFKYENFENSPNLMSPIIESVPRAISHIFKTYSRISDEEYEEKVKDLLPLEAIKYLEDKYLDLEYLYGTNLNVRLEDIYRIEPNVIDKQDGDYLRVLGDFVLIKYPELPLGDYYIGMFHEKGKDYDKALFYYKEAYGKMDPSDPKKNIFYQNIERILKFTDDKEFDEDGNPIEEPKEDPENEEEEEENN